MNCAHRRAVTTIALVTIKYADADDEVKMARRICIDCHERIGLGPSNDFIPYREFGAAREIANAKPGKDADRCIEWWAHRTEGYVDDVIHVLYIDPVLKRGWNAVDIK